MDRRQIEINSDEYQCWHEVAHALAILALQGEVHFIEFIDDKSSPWRARVNCSPPRYNKEFAACAGFAAELALFRDGYLPAIEEKEFLQIAFSNAAFDREKFLGKRPNEVEKFEESDDLAFMNCAIENGLPLIRLNYEVMQVIVDELLKYKRMEGARLKELLQ